MQKTPAGARPLSAGLLVSKGAARPTPVLGQRPTSGAPDSLFKVSNPAATPTPSHQSQQDVVPPSTKKAAFTFRMDERRHFRLRLLSAHENRSAQKIMEAALDAYLDDHAPQSDGLACACFSQEDR